MNVFKSTSSLLIIYISLDRLLITSNLYFIFVRRYIQINHKSITNQSQINHISPGGFSHLNILLTLVSVEGYYYTNALNFFKVEPTRKFIDYIVNELASWLPSIKINHNHLHTRYYSHHLYHC